MSVQEWKKGAIERARKRKLFIGLKYNLSDMPWKQGSTTVNHNSVLVAGKMICQAIGARAEYRKCQPTLYSFPCLVIGSSIVQ